MNCHRRPIPAPCAMQLKTQNSKLKTPAMPRCNDGSVKFRIQNSTFINLRLVSVTSETGADTKSPGLGARRRRPVVPRGRLVERTPRRTRLLGHRALRRPALSRLPRSQDRRLVRRWDVRLMANAIFSPQRHRGTEPSHTEIIAPSQRRNHKDAKTRRHREVIAPSQFWTRISRMTRIFRIGLHPVIQGQSAGPPRLGVVASRCGKVDRQTLDACRSTFPHHGSFLRNAHPASVTPSRRASTLLRVVGAGLTPAPASPRSSAWIPSHRYPEMRWHPHKPDTVWWGGDQPLPYGSFSTCHPERVNLPPTCHLERVSPRTSRKVPRSAVSRLSLPMPRPPGGISSAPSPNALPKLQQPCVLQGIFRLRRPPRLRWPYLLLSALSAVPPLRCLRWMRDSNQMR